MNINKSPSVCKLLGIYRVVVEFTVFGVVSGDKLSAMQEGEWK